MPGSGYAVATASPAAELFYFRRSVASNEKINGSSLAPQIIKMKDGTQDGYREL
jgi:hypothetical protein